MYLAGKEANPGMNKNNLLAPAAHIESIPPGRYDQSKPLHDDGSPSCLLAHMMEFFGDDADADDPRAAREAAERILGIEYGMAASLYRGRPFGWDAEKATPREAAMVPRRIANDKGAGWVRLRNAS